MGTVLIVEDHSVTRRVLVQILQKGGHTVLTAGHGREAIERLGGAQVDLVISDIAMPEMDGISLLKHLRADSRYRSLPVIIITASGQDEDRLVAQAEGSNGFLTKPVSSNELLELVRQFLH